MYHFWWLPPPQKKKQLFMQRSGLNIWEGPELAKKIKERGKKTKR